MEMMNQNGVNGFFALSEGCVALLLSLTTPRDVCRLSLVSKLFQSAGDSNFVWNKFLPSDYRNLIARSVNTAVVPEFSSTKHLYLHLSDHHIIIDGGTKQSFSLEKWSGKKCFMLAARDLMIIWGDTPEYWTWDSLPDARFEEVAVLRLVWWLEIRGKINTCLLSADTTYAAFLVYKLTYDANGFCGHIRYPAPEVSVKMIGGGGDECEIIQSAILDIPEIRNRRRYRWEKRASRDTRDTNYPKRREDGWLEVELGQFFNKRGEDGEVEMSLKEVKAGITKGGLIVQGIEIRPKLGVEYN